MSNPLIDKYNEIHGKKEEPKKPSNFISATSGTISINPSPPPLITYDTHSGNDSFLQVAENIKNKTAQVTSMTMNTDTINGYYTGLRTIIFEVHLYDTP
jgi:hypothetical protein